MMKTHTMWAIVAGVVVLALAGCGSDPGPVEPASDGGTGPARPCPYGSWAGGGEDGTACIPWTSCPEGHYVTVEATRQSDRECAPCAPGTRPIAENAAYCELIVTCVAGTYLSGEGTANPECVSCPSGTFSVRTNATSCRAWSLCPAGQYLAADGTATSDVTCAFCPSGFFSAANASADACSAWTDCVAGQYVSVAGTRSADRVCEVCPPDTYTNGPNQAMCVGVDACPPGTVQAAPATPSSAAVCSACTVGQYCAGDTTPAVPCSGGTWDHDADPATTCVARTSCAAGTYVSNEGNATHDRVCTPCSSGAYSSATNASACTPWTVCGAGTYVTRAGDASHDRMCTTCRNGTFSGDANADACTLWTVCGGGTYLLAPGTPTADRTCADCPPGHYNPGLSNVTMCTAWQECGLDHAEETPGSALWDRTCVPTGWTRQFGTSASDEARAVSARDFGFAFGGRTHGALPEQTSLGASDAFVQLYNRAGVLQWTRQFGTAGGDGVTSVSLAVDGSVFVTGYVTPTDLGSNSYFIRKYAFNGDLLWTHSPPWFPKALSVGTDGSVVVVGAVSDALSGQAFLGVLDAVVQKYDGSGSLLWTRQFGSPEQDEAVAVSVGGDGSVVIAGNTSGALPGQTNLGGDDVFVRKYDTSGTLVWTRQFGTSSADVAAGVSVGGDGWVVVAGSTSGALPGQMSFGNTDAFVQRYDSGAGVLLWTQQFGGPSDDFARAVSVASNGRVLVAGSTRSALPNQSALGNSDAFLVSYNDSGFLPRTRQFGSVGSDGAFAVSAPSYGGAVVAGSVGDALPGQVHLGGSDAFLRRFEEP